MDRGNIYLHKLKAAALAGWLNNRYLRSPGKSSEILKLLSKVVKQAILGT